MKKIAIIGLGNIGKRHLQGAINCNLECEVYGVDNNSDTLSNISQEYSDKCILYRNIEDLPKSIDLLVIATTSAVRREVLQSVFDAGIIVANIIFEKILFQKIEDYYWAQKELPKRGINAWINCVRRETKGYQMLKDMLSDVDEFIFNVYGGNWGLCCNGIHFIDIISYLANEKNIIIDEDGLELPIIDSKRKGFKECFGKLKGKAGKCISFSVDCKKESFINLMVYIYSNKFTMVIDEENRKAFVKMNKATDMYSIIEFDFPYVSEMAGDIMNDILSIGSCNLPEFDKSIDLHIKYFNIFKNFFDKNGMEGEKCPIT